jgi:hypothetical protein
MAGWLDRMVRRVRDANSTDAAIAVTHDYIDPNTGVAVDNGGGAPGGGGENDTHIHLHMNGEKGGGNGMDADPMNGNGNGNGGGAAPGDPAGGSDVAQLAARIAALEEQVQALMDGASDEEDVELEDPDTQDARRFRMRRRDAMRMRTGDEGAEVPVPERLGEDMVGETDLPGLEDLPQGSKGSTADSRRRAAYARTRDSMEQEDLWSDLVANAEIIAPGTRIPTFDARLPMKSTAERLCKYRRLVMEKGFKDAETAAVIQETVGIGTYDGIKPLGCDSVKMAFNAVAAAMAQQNNGRQVRRAAAQPTRDGGPRSGPPSIAEMNKQAKEFWSGRKTNGAMH